MAHTTDDQSTCLPASLRSHSQDPPDLPVGNAQTALRDDANAKESSRDNISRPTGSVFSRSDSAPVHDVPMRVIHRPLPSELDENKVQAFMNEMKAGDVFTPIELAKVRAPLKTDPTKTVHNFYFAMGGCHRYEATKRLGLETIRARIIDVPASQMRIYLGASSPF